MSHAYCAFLMAPLLPASAIHTAQAWFEQQGLVLQRKESIERTGVEGECIRFDISATFEWTVPRKAVLTLATELSIDIVVMSENEARQARKLVCFDMDSTLIQAEVIDELAREWGVYDEVAGITARAMQGEFDFQQSFRLRMGKLKGLPESTLASIAERLPLMPGVEHLLQVLNERGYRTAIISGGFTYFAEYLQQRLHFSEVHANTLSIEDGKVTGEVNLPILDADRKALILKEIAERKGFSPGECVAVGDGANDLKMLGEAGLGVAFHAKPLVREQAHVAISTLGLDALLYLLPGSE